MENNDFQRVFEQAVLKELQFVDYSNYGKNLLDTNISRSLDVMEDSTRQNLKETLPQNKYDLVTSLIEIVESNGENLADVYFKLGVIAGLTNLKFLGENQTELFKMLDFNLSSYECKED